MPKSGDDVGVGLWAIGSWAVGSWAVGSWVVGLSSPGLGPGPWPGLNRFIFCRPRPPLLFANPRWQARLPRAAVKFCGGLATPQSTSFNKENVRKIVIELVAIHYDGSGADVVFMDVDVAALEKRFVVCVGQCRR